MDTFNSTSEPCAPTCESKSCSTPDKTVWYCVHCSSSFCDECWPDQIPHGKDKVAPDTLRHEKSRKSIVELYRDIVQNKVTAAELHDLHRNDEDTLWFGKYSIHLMVIKAHKIPDVESHRQDGTTAQYLYDRGRFSSLMSNAAVYGQHEVKRPHLVSFIGDTRK